MSEWKTQVGDETIYRSCAWSPPGCHPVGCGIQVHVKDNKVVKVEGDPEHPITKGALCPRCLALPEYVHHPDRIIYPMKRAREDRGKDKWEQCTWDEALDIIETNAKKIIEESGPEAILVFGGTGREGNNYYNLIANAVFGTPNSVYAQSGWSCYGPRCVITEFMIGGGYPEIDYAQKWPDRYDHPGWRAPECILLWGKEPLKSNPDGMWGHSVIEMKRNFGTKLICVDPRITWLGSRADIVLQVRPGTDTALAMAMLDVMFTEGLYDKDFVDKWCWGAEQLAERVHEMPPSKAAEICGITEEEIYRAARMFGNAKPSSVAWGLAVDQNPNGTQLGQCLVALMTITGFIDAPGGTTLGMAFSQGEEAYDETRKDRGLGGGKTEERKRQVQMMTGFDVAVNAGILDPNLYNTKIGYDTFPAVCRIIWTADPDAVLDALETGEPYKPRMAYFSSSNPVGSAISASPQRWYEAMKDLDFNMVTDLFMNPTAMALCDVFLPLASTIEHNAMVVTHYGMNTSFYGAQNKCLQVGECKSDVEIMLEIGKRMHPEFWGQFENEDQYNEWNGLNGELSWDNLRNHVTIMTEEPYYKYMTGDLRPDGEIGFPTPSGRVELYANMYQHFLEDPLPYYMDPPFGPLRTPEAMKEYPFVMTTGARTYVSFHSEHRQVPSLRAMVPDPLLDMNPADAERLGLKEGDWAWIESPFGKCQERVHVTPTIKEGVVHAMHGWWYPEQTGEEPNLFGNWKSNINVTMPHEVNGKLGFGDCFKNMIVKVYPGDGVAESAGCKGALEAVVNPEAAKEAVKESGLPDASAKAATRDVKIASFAN